MTRLQAEKHKLAVHFELDAHQHKAQESDSADAVGAEGQNVGNFLTDRPSSRVLAVPGGISQIVFGDGARGIKAKVRIPSCCAAATLGHEL